MSVWYKDAIIYQLHVKCFFDSNIDGIGDFPGLIKKLDYIVSLGVTAIWLLPFYPSPLKDDGYDIADYYSIHPNYGNLVDFKRFLKEAHARKLKVITELVINHTSDQHEWFQLSRKAKRGSKWDSYYMWSETQDKYKEARIIFKDFESSNWAWDPVKQMYYWHRFYSHQPDLNFDSPFVKQEIYKILDFWFSMGVDGLRLDAIPYLYAREGTKCENLPETHQFLKELRRHVDEKFAGRMLLAEANQWPEDAICYLGSGDECHMAFHFPVMPRLFMAIQMEDSFPILDILDQTPPIPENCQWAMFLRNHDELTLEMVTDEERDYMYRMYAKDPKARINLGIRRRLSPLLQNNRAKFELMHILLFSLPGTPVIYYGDEIGMGDNYYLGDRNGVRTPMQWSSDRNAGFSRANPQQLYLPLIIDPQYHYENINVENEEQNPSSLLWWMRNVITLRGHYKAFGNGTLNFLSLKNSKVLSFIRKSEKETVLVVANLSKHSQYVELDLSAFCGYQPYDMFSQNKFPLIKESDYGISLGPYGYFWLSLEKEGEVSALSEERGLPEIVLTGGKDKLLQAPQFVKILQGYLPRCRWFKGKLKSVKLKEAIEVGEGYFLLLEDDLGDLYLLSVTVREKEVAHALLRDHPEAAVALIKNKGREWICLDAFYDAPFQRDIAKMINHRKIVRRFAGELKFHKKASNIPAESKIADNLIVYGDQYALKYYRRIEEGKNPDLEVVRYLTEKKFPFAPPYAGGIVLHGKKNRYDLAKLQKYEAHEGDAFSLMVEHAKLYFEGVRSGQGTQALEPFSLFQERVPEALRERFGFAAAEMAALIGVCTAKLHNALASSENDPAFNPEPFTFFDQRAVYDTMRKQIKLSAAYHEEVQEMQEVIKVLIKKRFAIEKIRIHGDFRLGQLTHRGKDFLICDFDGDRAKKLVVQDAAGMIYSFYEAAFRALSHDTTLREEEVKGLEPWASAWAEVMSGTFYSHYLAELEGRRLLPAAREERQLLLQAYLLDQALAHSSKDLSAFKAVWRVCKPAKTPSS